LSSDIPATPSVHETAIEQQLLNLIPKFSAAGKGSQLVLLVEDNDDLRSFLAGQLKQYYQVENCGKR
jgi:hypothetical protein